MREKQLSHHEIRAGGPSSISLMYAGPDSERKALLEEFCAERGLSFYSRTTQAREENESNLHYSLTVLEIAPGTRARPEDIEPLSQNGALLLLLPESDGYTSELESALLEKGAHDLLYLPCGQNLLLRRVQNTLDAIELKNRLREERLYASLQLDSTREWANYREIRRRLDEERAIIYNLKTSLSQGAGLGNSVQMIDMLALTKTETPEGYLMDREMMDLLISNNGASRKMLESLDAMVDIMERDLNRENVPIESLLERLPETLVEYVDILQAKDVQIIYPALRSRREIQADLEAIDEVIRELVLNAYKYSPPGAPIHFNAREEDNFFCLMVRNKHISGEGLYQEVREKLVVEPFFRGHLESFDDLALIEKFPMGLGLTMVDYTVRRHEGLFFIKSVDEGDGNGERDTILAGILFPLSPLAEGNNI